MKLPIIELFPKASREEFRKKFPNPTPCDAKIFHCMRTASTQFTRARVIFANSIGPNFARLIRRLVELADLSFEIPDKLMLRCEATEDAAARENGEKQKFWLAMGNSGVACSISPRKQAWDKVASAWIIPPLLTSDEVALIEDTAKHLHDSLTSCIYRGATKTQQPSPSHSEI